MSIDVTLETPPLALAFDTPSIIGGVLGFVLLVLWIPAMIDAARTCAWVWFILMLVFAPLALFYVAIQYPKNHRERLSGQRRRSKRRDVQSRLRELERQVEELKGEP